MKGASKEKSKEPCQVSSSFSHLIKSQWKRQTPTARALSFHSESTGYMGWIQYDLLFTFTQNINKQSAKLYCTDLKWILLRLVLFSPN